MESPPKRVTRARAAAKTTDTTVNTTKSTIAAPKARAPRVTATTKRKTRSDEDREEDELHQDPEPIIEPEEVASKTTRTKAKKPAPVQQEDQEMMDAPPTRSLRGKSIVTEPEEHEEAPKARGRPKRIVVDTPAEIAKTTRGRPRKTDVPTEQPVAAVEPKRITRGRAATITKTAAPKKSVKFEEPDKENAAPTTGTKGVPKEPEVATGIRGKPIRKPPVPRATRARPTTEAKKADKSPLSPKKITQVGSLAKDSQSEDELATTEKTPMKPLSKSPIKPPGSIFNTVKRLDFASTTNITVNRVTTHDLGSSMMGSPARRPAQSPFKESMKTSPQRTVAQNSMRSPFKPSLGAPAAGHNQGFKASLMSSPARRPAPTSPIKVDESGSPSRSGKNSLFGATPRATPFKISRFTTPRTLNIKHIPRTGQTVAPPSAPPKFVSGSPKATTLDIQSTSTLEPQLQFSGRLSSIMPRSADPALKAGSTRIVEAPDLVVGDEPVTVRSNFNALVDEVQVTEPATPVAANLRQVAADSFEARLRDESPFDDSESEDELASVSPKYSPVPLSTFKVSAHDFASSPIAFQSISTPKTAKSTRPSFDTVQSGRKDKLAIGFTPLAAQLNTWMTNSPEKKHVQSEEQTSPTAFLSLDANELVEAGADPSPAKSQFFDEQMSVLEEMAEAAEPEIADGLEIAEGFEPIDLDEEDLALAEEADEMSMLDPEQLDMFDQNEDMFAINEIEAGQNNATARETPVTSFSNEDVGNLEDTHFLQQSFEQALSEASQEYGDENAAPIDPSLRAAPLAVFEAPIYNTPKQVLRERTFHTVSKVPLKPAADDTPLRSSPVKRSASSSKVPSQRPTNNLTRNNTVISYSPVKGTPRAKTPTRDIESTPKTEWSSVATPARTPRRDLNLQLLKGAVVFVDVHTTEGADASVLFTELLTQMGARCVKSWNWNSNDESSKIGITHVVFKDGGKRTIEKVRETKGLVTCVGVGWVLDCERENQWLSEAPYAVDTAAVPRGGHRRRKSMEPKALANMNGTLVASDTPARISSYTFQANTPLTSKARRRDSVQWVRSSPASSSSPDSLIANEEDFLSPIPATPAQHSEYGDEGLAGFETPGAQTPYFLKQGVLVQQTAPVKRFADDSEEEEESRMGSRWGLAEKKDESVMMRLMLARRKSLQWAPKVGSPLAR